MENRLFGQNSGENSGFNRCGILFVYVENSV
jgi:hypothetical protein